MHTINQWTYILIVSHIYIVERTVNVKVDENMPKRIGISFVSLVFLSITATATSNITTPTKHELLKYLLDPNRYDSSMFPGYCTGNQSEVIVQLAVTDIYDISDIGMEFQMILYLRMKWKDINLTYKENATYDKLELTGDKVNELWTPDIYFLDARQSGIHTVIKEEKLAHIRPDGQVSYSNRLSVTSHCNMDLNKFPFDNQNCTIILQSYAFTTEALVLRWTEDHPFQLLNTNIPQFIASFDNNDVTQGTYTFEHSIIGGNFSFLQTSIQLKRNGKSYISMYIAPYAIFMGLATASFGLKEIVPKLTACSGALTTTILQWIAIYSKLPTTAYLSDLDGWILRHIIFIGCIFFYHIVHFWFNSLCPIDKCCSQSSCCKNPNNQETPNQNNPNNEETPNQNIQAIPLQVLAGQPPITDNCSGRQEHDLKINWCCCCCECCECSPPKHECCCLSSCCKIGDCCRSSSCCKKAWNLCVGLFRGLVYEKTGSKKCYDLLTGCVVFVFYSVHCTSYLTAWGWCDMELYKLFSLLIVVVVGIHLLAYYCCYGGYKYSCTHKKCTSS